MCKVFVVVYLVVDAAIYGFHLTIIHSFVSNEQFVWIVALVPYFNFINMTNLMLYSHEHHVKNDPEKSEFPA